MDDSGKFSRDPVRNVGSSPEMAEALKTTIRWDEGLKSDAERCAKARGISVAEFNRQAITHYVAWCASQKDAQENDKEPPRG